MKETRNLFTLYFKLSLPGTGIVQMTTKIHATTERRSMETLMISLRMQGLKRIGRIAIKTTNKRTESYKIAQLN